jgi:hypothetical protein
LTKSIGNDKVSGIYMLSSLAWPVVVYLASTLRGDHDSCPSDSVLGTSCAG